MCAASTENTRQQYYGPGNDSCSMHKHLNLEGSPCQKNKSTPCIHAPGRVRRWRGPGFV